LLLGSLPLGIPRLRRTGVALAAVVSVEGRRDGLAVDGVWRVGVWRDGLASVAGASVRDKQETEEDTGSGMAHTLAPADALA